jgi:HTH-type transcriptional regulator, transcriptional repressor of NAD biosynthesis genes
MDAKSQIKKGMKKGLVLGKFMPVHTGHVALIDFALEHCDELILLLCYHAKEPIDGELRTCWLKEIYSGNPKVRIYPFEYDPVQLSDSSVSSIENSYGWSEIIKKNFPDVTILFSSENYGEYVAEMLGIRHVYFDEKRSFFPVSSSQIRYRPSLFWDFIPAVVQPFFLKKIAIVGSESTGKSTLTERLARHYETSFAAEAAREIIGHTRECTYEDLKNIALYHAQSILQKQNLAKRFLFIDTEIHITKSYSSFLFNRELSTDQWIEKANQCDLYLFLEPDCTFIQDGTRLDEDERSRLDRFHKQQFKNAGLEYISIAGNWEERFILACDAINRTFLTQ